MVDKGLAIWLAIVAIAGGLVGFITRIEDKDLNNWRIVRAFVVSMLASSFIAYISYEVAYHFVGSQRLSIAIAGYMAYAGTDFINKIQAGLADSILKWLDKRSR